MIDPLWRQMYPKIVEQKEAAEHHVLSGGLDRDDYVRMCERVRCINEILGLAVEAEEAWMRMEHKQEEIS